MPGPNVPMPSKRPKMVRWPGQEQVHGPTQTLLPTLIPQEPGTSHSPHTSDHDTHKHVDMVMIWISNVLQRQSDHLSCQFSASPEVQGTRRGLIH